MDEHDPTQDRLFALRGSGRMFAELRKAAGLTIMIELGSSTFFSWSRASTFLGALAQLPRSERIELLADLGVDYEELLSWYVLVHRLNVVFLRSVLAPLKTRADFTAAEVAEDEQKRQETIDVLEQSHAQLKAALASEPQDARNN